MIKAREHADARPVHKSSSGDESVSQLTVT